MFSLPALAKQSVDIFGVRPWAMIAIGLPGVIFDMMLRLWWTPSIDLLTSPFSVGISEIVSAALIYATASAYRGERPGIVESYRRVFTRLGPLFALLIRYLGAMTLLAVTLVGIPFAIRIFIRWGFGTQALLLHNTTPKEAISLSCRAVDGLWWQVAGTVLVIAALLSLPVIAAWILWGLSSAEAVVLRALVSATLGPIAVIFWTALFLQLQDRHELSTTSFEELQPA